jgi:hypothetical protein
MVHVLHTKKERVLFASIACEGVIDALSTLTVLPQGVHTDLAVETTRLVAALRALRVSAG